MVKGSLVANHRLISGMMNFVTKNGVWSHVKTIQLEEGTNLPDRYMNQQLKGRLVVTM